MSVSVIAFNIDKNFERFAEILAASGPREALAFLVSLTDYRFISVFQSHADKATAVIYYDRENPSDLSTEEVPHEATYCSYVAATGKAFSTENSQQDPRLVNHAARDIVLSYCGVPILDPEGTVLGTLCHYDVVPRSTEQLDFGLLLQVASALQQGHHVPAYPSTTK